MFHNAKQEWTSMFNEKLYLAWKEENKFKTIAMLMLALQDEFNCKYFFHHGFL